MDLLSLAGRCREETNKFRDHLPSDPSFCLEIWRHALHGATEHERNAAWACVDEHYRPQVRHWFEMHELAPRVLRYGYYTTADDFVQNVFLNMVRANKESPLRTDSLQEVLAYVRRCLINEIFMVLRRPRPPTISLDELTSMPSADDIEELPISQEGALTIWKRLCSCITAAADDLVAHRREKRLMILRWVYGYRPNELVQALPHEYPNAHEIHRILAKIKVCYKRRYRSIS